MRKLLASLILISTAVLAGDTYRGDTGTVLTNSQVSVTWTNTSTDQTYFYPTAISGVYATPWTGTWSIVHIAGTRTAQLYTASVTGCTTWTWEPLNRYHVGQGQKLKVTDQGTNGVIKIELNN